MMPPDTLPEVLTLDEAAAFLRLPPEVVARHAGQGRIPGRRIDRDWRFLKESLEDWLRGVEPPPAVPPGEGTRAPATEEAGPPRAGSEALLAQSGRLAADPTLGPMLEAIYAERGRPEADPDAPR